MGATGTGRRGGRAADLLLALALTVGGAGGGCRAARIPPPPAASAAPAAAAAAPASAPRPAPAAPASAGEAGPAPPASQAITAETGTRAEAASPTRPTRLDIPAIGVQADVEPVGVLATGLLGVPSNWTDVAWYRDGPIPGQPGDAVIDGHLDSYTGPAVFWRLASLRRGDAVRVLLSSGRTVAFSVDTLEQLDYQSRDVGAIFSDEGPPTLTLITCGGPWLAAQHVYADRLVVRAVLVPPENEDGPQGS